MLITYNFLFISIRIYIAANIKNNLIIIVSNLIPKMTTDQLKDLKARSEALRRYL